MSNLQSEILPNNHITVIRSAIKKCAQAQISGEYEPWDHYESIMNLAASDYSERLDLENEIFMMFGQIAASAYKFGYAP